MSKRLGEKKYKEDWMIWIRVAHSTTRRRAREQHLAVARGGELGRGLLPLQAIGNTDIRIGSQQFSISSKISY